MFTGIVFGIGSKLAAVAVRYFILGRWLGYREFMTPAQLEEWKLANLPVTDWLWDLHPIIDWEANIIE